MYNSFIDYAFPSNPQPTEEGWDEPITTQRQKRRQQLSATMPRGSTHYSQPDIDYGLSNWMPTSAVVVSTISPPDSDFTSMHNFFMPSVPAGSRTTSHLYPYRAEVIQPTSPQIPSQIPSPNHTVEQSPRPELTLQIPVTFHDGTSVSSSPITPRSVVSSHSEVFSQHSSQTIPISPIASEGTFTYREQHQLFREAVKLRTHPTYWGPFVSQPMYKPHTNSDRRRYVEEVLLDAPILFESIQPEGYYGILLSDAIRCRFKKLNNADVPVFLNRGPSVSIRLEWPGYRRWSRQIPTKDFKSPPGPITRAKLAKNIAKCVQRFIEDRENCDMEDDSDPAWRVGRTTGRIKLEDLLLVSVYHVSMGSWQPQLRLVRGH